MSKQSELAALIRQGGYSKGEGKLFYLDQDKEFYACALGQVALNAGILTKERAIEIYNNEEDEQPIYEALAEKFGLELTDTIWLINDAHTDWSLSRIAQYIEDLPDDSYTKSVEG